MVSQKNKQMKILHILWECGNGGMENLTKNIILNKKLKNNSYLLIINENIDKNLIDGIPEEKIININRKKNSKNIFDFFKLYHSIFKLKPNIIHIHFYNLLRILKPLKKILRFKIVLTIHGMDDFDKSIKLSDKVVAVSKTHFNHIINNCTKQNWYINNLTMIYNGINTGSSLLKVGSKSNHKKFFIVGRLNHHQKKQDIIIDVFHKHLKSSPNDTLTIFGDGDSRNYLNEKIKNYRLEENIFIKGSVSNNILIKSMNEFDAMISGADYETFGINLIESLFFGIPVISYYAETAIEVCGKNPLSHFYQSDKELLEKMKNFSNNINMHQRQLSKNHIKKNYDLNITVDNYLKLYKDIL